MTGRNLPAVKRPTDGEMYVWTVGNIDWLERTEGMLRAAFPRAATIEEQTTFEVAMHRFGVQLESLRRMRRLYEVLGLDEMTTALCRWCGGAIVDWGGSLGRPVWGHAEGEGHCERPELSPEGGGGST